MRGPGHFALGLNGSLASFSLLFNDLRNNSKWTVTLGSEYSGSHFQSGNRLFAAVNLLKVSRLICPSGLQVLTYGISHVRPNCSERNAVFPKGELKLLYEYGFMPPLAFEAAFQT